MSARILVVGISATDITVHSQRLPNKGEIVFGKEYMITGGGKGANQAVAAVRLGADTSFISKVGNDEFGNNRVPELVKEGINIDYLIRDEENNSSLNLVTMDKRGDNQSITSLGASYTLSPEDILKAEAVFKESEVLIISSDLPVNTFKKTIELASKYGLFIIFNPIADKSIMNADYLKDIHLLVCNKNELGIITGEKTGHLETVVPAAGKLTSLGLGCVVCTLGAEGVVAITNEYDDYYETFEIVKKDINGAGDTFISGLAYSLSINKALKNISVSSVIDLRDAFRNSIAFACACSSISISKSGTQTSFPNLTQVEKFLEEHGEYIGEMTVQRKLLPSADLYQFIEEKTYKIRKLILQMITEAASGHPGGALSSADIMTVLFFHELKLNVNQLNWSDRDRFILSKGHVVPVLYACLIEKGILKPEEVSTLRKFGSRLQGHPDMNKAPGIEMSTGSLGQGLSVANGIALGAKLDEKDLRVYVLLGDGEIQEGQVWEASMSSVHFKLDNLCAIIDYNGLQIGGTIGQVKSTIEPLVDKWENFGWHVIEINGHSIHEIISAFNTARKVKGRPTMIIAHTIKGKGVSFMERSVEYHGKPPSYELLKTALKELEQVKQVDNV